MTENRRREPASGFLEQATLSALAGVIAQRRSWLIAGALVGALLGVMAGLMGVGAGTGAYATVREVPPWKYEALQVPDVFSLDRDSLINRIQYGLSASSNLSEAIEAAKGNSANLLTYLPRANLQMDGIQLNVEPFDSVGKPSAEQKSGLRLQLTGTHPLVAVEILKDVVARAEVEMKTTLLSDFRSALNVEKTKVNLKLDAARNGYGVKTSAELAKLEEAGAKAKLLLADRLRAVRLELAASRQARIQQLGEAIKVAQAVGQIKPAALIAANDAGRPLGAQGLDGRSVPLFLFGSEALNEQLRVLLNRNSDDHDDSRVAEILRDGELLKFDREAEAIKSRTSVEAYFEDYSEIVERKRVLDQIQPEKMVFEMMQLDQRPNKGDFSAAIYMLDRILRGLALGLVLATLLVTGGHLLRFVRQ